MKQTDMNQLIDKLTEQRNKAEAERNLLNTLILDKIREVEALKKENDDLRESLHSAIYETH
jgi:FKBP-type peptidyl-prolyl cis-trans isomerase (trigger factor)